MLVIQGHRDQSCQALYRDTEADAPGIEGIGPRFARIMKMCGTDVPIRMRRLLDHIGKVVVEQPPGIRMEGRPAPEIGGPTPLRRDREAPEASSSRRAVSSTRHDTDCARRNANVSSVRVWKCSGSGDDELCRHDEAAIHTLDREGHASRRESGFIHHDWKIGLLEGMQPKLCG